jgi:predicted Zn-dependent protease with MMP-like domain
MSTNKHNFEQLIQGAFDRIPEMFRVVCSEVVIRADDFASEEVLSALEIQNPYHLLGLYHGVNLAHKSVLDLPTQPDMVLLYRKPIIAYSEKTKTPLAEVIQHVLVHELGHHLGFSDADMEAIELSRDEAYDARDLPD